MSDTILLFEGINCYSYPPVEVLILFEVPTYKSFDLKIYFFRIQEKIKFDFYYFVKVCLSKEDKNPENNDFEYQKFGFHIYAYDIFKRINGRNFHLESIIMNQIPYK